MQLFYSTDIQPPYLRLSDDESRHCAKVLRMKIGDSIEVVDGQGNLFHARLIETDARQCTAEITEQIENFNKIEPYLHIACAPTKNADRFEWFVEKATEMGIDEITPIICEHAERKHINIERLERIAIAAMKQSQKAFLPKINEAIRFKDFCKQPFDGQKMIAYCGEIDKQPLAKNATKGKNNLILIGPEGDFSEQEVRQAMQENFAAITLGNQRLRTETAALYACFSSRFLNE